MRTIKIENFTFFAKPPWDERRVFRVLIPSSIEKTEDLFYYYASLLQIGGYFGHNWDALDEILRDFEWIEETEIEILHDGLPKLADENELKLYLGMLSDTVDFWSGRGINAPFLTQRTIKHKFSVYFPEDTRQAVENLVS